MPWVSAISCRLRSAARSHTSSAFWACRRFSASSQMIALRAVDDLGGDLVAAVGRQAVDEDGVGGRERHERGVDLVLAECGDARRLLLLLAHRHPGVGDDDVDTGDGLARVGPEVDGAARLPAMARASATTASRGAKPAGEATRTCMPAVAPASR